MSLSVKRLHPLFGAEVTGVDLGQPIGAEMRQAIADVMDEYAVSVLPGQPLDDEHQIAFASLFGPLEVAPIVKGKNGARGVGGNRIKHREIFDISNLDEQRTDSRRRRPARGLPAGQPTLAHRQLVPAEVGDVVDAACAHRSAGRRRHRIRRHPRRLRRAARPP